MAATGSDESVLIRFGASIDDAKANIGALASFIRGFAEGVTAELKDAGGPIADLGKRFKDLGEEFTKAGTKALGSFGPVLESALNVFGKSATLIGLSAVGAAVGVEKLSAANAEMVQSTRDLARALGITTNEASVMQAVFGEVGASQSEYLGLSKGLSNQLRTNEAAMVSLGLVTRDAVTGNLRPLNELTIDAIALLREYKEGTDRSVAARELFGRGLSASSRLLQVNNEMVEKNRTLVEELGLTVGESAVNAWKDYDEASHKAELTQHAFAKAIQESVLPVGTELLEWFNNLAPAAIEVLRGAIGGLSTAFLGLTNGVRVVWEVINAMVISAAEPIRALGAAIGKALVGDFEGAAQEIKGVGSTIGGAWEGALKKIDASSQETHDRIASIWAFTGGPQGAGDSGSPKGSKNAPDIAGDKERLKAEEQARKEAEREAARAERERQRAAKEQERLAKAAAQERARIAVAEYGLAKAQNEASLGEQQEYLRESMSITDDAYKNNLISTKEYYDAKLAIETRAIDLSIEAKKRETEEVRTQAKSPDLKEPEKLKFQAQEAKLAGEINVLEQKRIDLVRSNASEYNAEEQRRADAMEGIRINAAKASGQAEIAAMQESTSQRRALLQIDAEQEVIERAQAERRAYEVERAGLSARLELAHGDATKRAEIFAQMADLDQQHENRLTQISNAGIRERQKYMLQANQQIRGSFEGFLNDIMSGTKKLSTAFHEFVTATILAVQNMIAKKLGDKIFDSLGGNKVVEMLVKPFDMAIDWLVGLFAKKEAIQTAATAAGTAERTAIEGAAEEESLLAMAAGAVKRIAISAWEAAASVYASIAAIPYVGPFLAPAMAIGAAALVLGFAKNIASAEGGWWQVPGDQMAQLHKNEMVLPSTEAQGVRTLIANAQRGMKPTGGGGGDTFVVHATDAKSFKALLMDNAGAVAGAVREHARNGGIQARS